MYTETKNAGKHKNSPPFGPEALRMSHHVADHGLHLEDKSSDDTRRALMQPTLTSFPPQEATVQKHTLDPLLYLKLTFLSMFILATRRPLLLQGSHRAGHCIGNTGDKAQQYELLLSVQLKP